ncbi:MAG: hypothetical protein MMC23_004675 [Stictis urceolatum]|nr:hypothetical protein [Stictis urceolata]
MSVNEEPTKSGPSTKGHFRYRLEHREKRGILLRRTDSSQPIKTSLPETNSESPFEVVTTVLVPGDHKDAIDGERDVSDVSDLFEGQIVVDHSTYQKATDPKSGEGITLNKDGGLAYGDGRVNECSCVPCGRKTSGRTNKKATFDEMQDIPHKAINPEYELSDENAILMNRALGGFSLKLKKWVRLDIASVQSIDHNRNAIDNLVMSDGHKDVIKSLAAMYSRAPAEVEPDHGAIDGAISSNSFQPYAADVVKGKGDGQTTLLHGSPRVGKTMTAETAAESLGRPLLALASGSLGTSIREVEEKLSYWTSTARRWGAILLIDEAEVYLESRSSNDLERNSLVAVFLQALEYYQGIIFLTTNRVGAFDEAISSRIHISLYYPPFNEVKRQAVWNIHLRRLQKERPHIQPTIDLQEYIQTSDKLRRLEWNGRQIRNAEYSTSSDQRRLQRDGEQPVVRVQSTHLEKVVNMSHDLKEYRRTLVPSDSKEMRSRGLRNDE